MLRLYDNKWRRDSRLFREKKIFQGWKLSPKWNLLKFRFEIYGISKPSKFSWASRFVSFINWEFLVLREKRSSPCSRRPNFEVDQPFLRVPASNMYKYHRLRSRSREFTLTEASTNESPEIGTVSNASAAIDSRITITILNSIFSM